MGRILANLRGGGGTLEFIFYIGYILLLTETKLWLNEE
jgi:hypothetical protein